MLFSLLMLISHIICAKQLINVQKPRKCQTNAMSLIILLLVLLYVVIAIKVSKNILDLYYICWNYRDLWKSCVAAECGIPPPGAITKLLMSLQLAMTCFNRLTSLKFVGDTLSVSALISLVILTFDLLTLNLVRIIAGGVGNYATDFGVSETFHSRHMGQHLSDGPRDLATLIYGSSCSICLPNLKFEGRSIREIWRTSALNIIRPGNLDLWPMTLKLVRIIALTFRTYPTPQVLRNA